MTMTFPNEADLSTIEQEKTFDGKEQIMKRPVHCHACEKQKLNKHGWVTVKEDDQIMHLCGSCWLTCLRALVAVLHKYEFGEPQAQRAAAGV